MTGTLEQVAEAVQRLRATGWCVSHEQPVREPFDGWTLLVRPPVAVRQGRRATATEEAS